MHAGIVLMAIFWSVPIALMAAEMGTSVPVRNNRRGRLVLTAAYKRWSLRHLFAAHS
jgi:hypothetical protein